MRNTLSCIWRVWWVRLFVAFVFFCRDFSLTAAVLPAIAFLVIVHGAVLAGFLAALRLCGKSGTANRCRQNRKQNFRVIFHRTSLARNQKRG
jgi:hypothetical protein